MSTSDQSPVQKVEDSKPVVWTPEDASRFLASAIQEAQRPLSDQLKERPITSRWLTIIIAAMVIIALGVALILSSHLERAERVHSTQLQEVDKKLEAVRAAREEVLAEKLQLQSSATTLEDRLATVRERSEQLQQQIEGMRGGEDELKRAKSDLQRFRRQNELLRSQISGLEMEKVALARQLDAVRAMALDDAEDGDLGEPEDGGEITELQAAPTEQVDETPTAPVAPAAKVEPAVPAPAPSPSPAESEAAETPAPSDEEAKEPDNRSSFQAASEEFGSQLARERTVDAGGDAIQVEKIAENEPEAVDTPASAPAEEVREEAATAAEEPSAEREDDNGESSAPEEADEEAEVLTPTH